MLAFDPAKSGVGATTLYFKETVLHWDSLGVDPKVIAENSARIKERFEPADHDNHYPVAVVAYGPSLRETWKELYKYSTIITCSGAHKFLLERGVIPTYHVESDPRIHKVDMLGEVCDRTTYLPASICHPRYFDKLLDSRIVPYLWHILFSDPQVYKYIPTGDWILTGGNTVGPRAIKIARLLGFTDLQMFGFDGSGKHADVHGNPPPDSKYRELHYKGVTYVTTENLFRHIDQLFQDLDTIPDARFTFHGEGLIQAIAKSWKYQFKEGYPLAVVKDD